MSKTFKSVALPNVSVSIKRSSDGVRICSVHGPDVSNVTIAPSDAPSVMLAIGEATGVEPALEEYSKYGTPEHLAHIQWHLREYAKAQEANAAAEADRVKLEAEALKLAQAGCEAVGDDSAETLDEMTVKDQKFFLAVARAARELNKEAGQ